MHCGCCGRPGGTMRLGTRRGDTPFISPSPTQTLYGAIQGPRCWLVHARCAATYAGWLKSRGFKPLIEEVARV